MIKFGGTGMLQNKKSLRAQMIAKRDLLKPDYIYAAEEAALKKLVSKEAYQQAETVMLYMDFRNEFPTGKLISNIISSGKTLVLPLTDKDFTITPYAIPSQNGTITDFLKISSLGILEPNPDYCTAIDPKMIDLVIVPGVAFDQSGNRLGYGKGCYDHFLPKLRKDTVKLALAYDFQILESIPTDSNDIKMDDILFSSIRRE